MQSIPLLPTSKRFCQYAIAQIPQSGLHTHVWYPVSTTCLFPYLWSCALPNYRCSEYMVCSGAQSGSWTLQLDTLLWDKANRMHHNRYMVFVLVERIWCPFGTKSLLSNRPLDHPARSFHVPPLKKIPVPLRTVKRYNRRSSWSHLERTECQSLQMEEGLLASLRYWVHICLRLAQVIMKYGIDSLCSQFHQVAGTHLAWALLQSPFARSDCKSSLVAGDCKWADDSHLACCFLPGYL